MKEVSIQAITAAIKALTDKGIKPTQKAVQLETGLSIATIKRHWKDRELVTTNRVSKVEQGEPTRVSKDTNRVSTSAFDKFRQRAINTPNSFHPASTKEF